jgi:hypothetical protein
MLFHKIINDIIKRNKRLQIVRIATNKLRIRLLKKRKFLFNSKRIS